MTADPQAGRLYLGPNWTPAIEEASNYLLAARIVLKHISLATDYIEPPDPVWNPLWRAHEEAVREEKRRAFLWRDRGGQAGWEPGV